MAQDHPACKTGETHPSLFDCCYHNPSLRPPQSSCVRSLPGQCLDVLLLVSREDGCFKSTVCSPPHHSGRTLSISEMIMIMGDGWILVLRPNSLLVRSVACEVGVYQRRPPLGRCLPVLVECWHYLCTKRNAPFPTTSHLTEACPGSFLDFLFRSSHGGVLASMCGFNLDGVYDRVHYMEVEPPPPDLPLRRTLPLRLRMM